MKKTIIMILILLPVVLLVVIGIAGATRNFFKPAPVERVEFVDKHGNPYVKGMWIDIAWGTTDTTSLNTRIYPENADNKKVIFTSADPSICTVNEEGHLTGVLFGTTYIHVYTVDGNKTASVEVRVSADTPVAINLAVNEVTLKPKEFFDLSNGLEVIAPVAVNKAVRYTSSDESVVRVNAQGMLEAVAPGEATVTVTAVLGGVFSTCTVRVEEGKPPLYFDFEGAETIFNPENSDLFITKTAAIDLKTYLQCDELLPIEDVTLEVVSGNATLSNGVLTIYDTNVVIVRAYAGNKNNPAALATVKLLFVPQ